MGVSNQKQSWSHRCHQIRRLELINGVKSERIFSNQKAVRPRADERRKGTRTKKSETRYIREIVYGKRNKITYWEITTDPETMPENSTSFVMTNISEKTSKLKKILGNLYRLRIWVEYG